MKIDLSGKTALVTGSTRGIGLASANGLVAAGADVIVHGRNADEVAALAESLRCRGVAADLGTADGCATVVESVGDVDIVVNNAGIFEAADFFESTDAEWDRHWQVNVMSAMRLSRAFAPAMVDRGWGRIVMLGSESSFNIPTEMIHYGVSKAADVALARGLAKRLAGTGVTVNSVLPGPTLTETVQSLLDAGAAAHGTDVDTFANEAIMQMRPSSLIQRAASVDEVANMVVYVCSTQASATTGASLRVEGGIVDSL